MKRAFFLLIGILVSVACFAMSLKGVNLDELADAFSEANYLTLPLMLGLLFGFYWLKTMRWSWMLRPVEKLTTRQLFGPMLIGFAANNLLPAHLGEFIRVYVVRRQYGVPLGTVLSTVVLERIFDVMAILALFGIGLAYSGELPADYRNGALMLGGGALAVVAAVIVYLIWTEWFVSVTATVMGKLPLPPSLTKKIVEMLRTGADGLGSLRSVRSVTAIIVSSMVQWLLNGMIAFVALRAFGIPVSLATGLIVTGVTAVAVTIPSSPGYFGVIQVAFRLSMEAQANPPDPALVLGSSFYYHLSMYIPEKSDVRQSETP
jgi:uncharacterized protein (TIRG00374 family)